MNNSEILKVTFKFPLYTRKVGQTLAHNSKVLKFGIAYKFLYRILAIMNGIQCSPNTVKMGNYSELRTRS